MFAVVWCGTDEHDKRCPSLSRYKGDSQLMTAILERDAPQHGDGLGYVPKGQLGFWGTQPKRLTDQRRAMILQAIRKGRSMTQIARSFHCSTRTVYEVKRGGNA